MAYWHGYLGIENLALTDPQKAQLVDALKSLGPQSNPQPCMLNHWRIRLDGNAVIFEALWDEDTISIQAVKVFLANIFDVDTALITHISNNQSFAGSITPVVTFSYQSTDRLVMALFGGIIASWQESGDECRGYLALYSNEWESE